MNFLYTLDITIVSQVFTSTLRCSSSGFVLSSWAVSTSSSILSPPSPPSLLPKSTQARVASCPLPFAQPTPQHRPPLTQSRRWPRGPAPRQTASGTHRVETPTPHTRKPRAGIRDTRANPPLPTRSHTNDALNLSTESSRTTGRKISKNAKFVLFFLEDETGRHSMNE